MWKCQNTFISYIQLKPCTQLISIAIFDSGTSLNWVWMTECVNIVRKFAHIYYANIYYAMRLNAVGRWEKENDSNENQSTDRKWTHTQDIQQMNRMQTKCAIQNTSWSIKYNTHIHTKTTSGSGWNRFSYRLLIVRANLMRLEINELINSVFQPFRRTIFQMKTNKFNHFHLSCVLKTSRELEIQHEKKQLQQQMACVRYML